MNEYIKKIALTVVIVLLTASAFVGVGYALYLVMPHFLVFFLAYLTALILEPLNNLFMRIKHVNRLAAVTTSFVLFMGLLAVLTYLSTTKLLKEFISLTKFIQRSLPDIQDWFVNLYNNIHDYIMLLPEELATQINDNFFEFTQKLLSIDIVTPISNFVVNLSKSIPNTFILTIIFFVALFLLSLYLPKFHSGFLNLFTDRKREVISVLLEEIKKATIGFLRGQIMLSTITYIISFAGLKILDVKYAAAIALLIVIVDILPILGTGSTLGPWAIFSIAMGQYMLGIGLLVLFLVITVVRKSIEPKVFGERIGIGPLATLISIWVGFKAIGVVGVLVGPLLVILFQALVKIGVISRDLKI